MTNTVTKEQIQALMQRVIVHTSTCQHPTPHVIACAWLDDNYLLSTAMSKAVDPANFNEQMGIKYSTESALKEAEEKLWQGEGYALYTRKYAPSTYVQRLEAEYKENSERLVKLKEFLDKGMPSHFDLDAWDDLLEQYKLQKPYVEHLEYRLDKANNMQ